MIDLTYFLVQSYNCYSCVYACSSVRCSAARHASFRPVAKEFAAMLTNAITWLPFHPLQVRWFLKPNQQPPAAPQWP